MARSHESDYMPLVYFHLVATTAGLSNTEKETTWSIENLGKGPALRIKYVFTHPKIKLLDGHVSYLPPRAWEVKRCSVQPPHLRYPAAEPLSKVGEIRATYEDIFGNRFVSLLSPNGFNFERSDSK
jgi:hypothetical protein